jgi:hypothetical protein
MKLAVSTYSLLRWRNENGKTLEQSLEWIAKSAGVDGVEFTAIGDDAKRLVRSAAGAAEALRQARPDIVSYCVGAELLVPPASSEGVVERLKRQVDVAADPRRAVDASRRDPRHGRDIVPGDAQSGCPADPRGRRLRRRQGIKTSLENHGFYMQESKRVEQLIRAVDHENFG